MNVEAARADLQATAKRQASQRNRYEKSRAELREAVRQAFDAGVSESEVARIAGISRNTVRMWTGR